MGVKNGMVWMDLRVGSGVPCHWRYHSVARRSCAVYNSINLQSCFLNFLWNSCTTLVFSVICSLHTLLMWNRWSDLVVNLSILKLIINLLAVEIGNSLAWYLGSHANLSPVNDLCSWQYFKFWNMVGIKKKGNGGKLGFLVGGLYIVSLHHYFTISTGSSLLIFCTKGHYERNENG